MWYTTTLNNQPAVMFFDENRRVCFVLGDNPFGWGDKYDQWIADGNTPQQWDES